MKETIGSLFEFRDNDRKYRDEALVLTHPYTFSNPSNNKYLNFIEDCDNRLDVYFVPGTIALEEIDLDQENRKGAQRTIPSGYLDNYYDGVIRESEGHPGNVLDEDAKKLLEENQRILLGGENLLMCLRRTYNDLVENKIQNNYETDIAILEEASYAPVPTVEGLERMESLENIRKEQLPIYDEDILHPEFTGDKVKVYKGNYNQKEAPKILE